MRARAFFLAALAGWSISHCLAESPTTTTAPSKDIAAVVESSNAFALDLYAKLAAEKKGNLFFSPASIHTALAMTYAGAAGNTADQMAKALHFTLPADRLSAAYGDLVGTLNSPARTDEGQPAYQLTVANGLWGQKGYAFKPAFAHLLQKNYGAGLNEVDFGQPEAARKAINDWATEQTRDKIKDLIPAGILDDKTRLVLTNAVYFKSNWACKFRQKDTKDGPFRVSAKESVDVPMMNMTHPMVYIENSDLQMLELPYILDGLSMLILLPRNVEGIKDLENKLNLANLNKWQEYDPKEWENGQQPIVEITLPKFGFSSDFTLAGALRRMGVTDAFTANKAALSRITDTEGVSLATMTHKAFVAVDENGTEAGATVASRFFGGQANHKAFKADHPFLFLIRHNATGEILFLGRVMNPKDE